MHAGPRLTDIERQILELAAAGATVPDTARRLGRSPKTIENAVTRLNKRFGTTSRVDAAAAARSEGLLGGNSTLRVGIEASSRAPGPRLLRERAARREFAEERGRSKFTLAEI